MFVPGGDAALTPDGNYLYIFYLCHDVVKVYSLNIGKTVIGKKKHIIEEDLNILIDGEKKQRMYL
jgi:hypothetical protein